MLMFLYAGLCGVIACLNGNLFHLSMLQVGYSVSGEKANLCYLTAFRVRALLGSQVSGVLSTFPALLLTCILHVSWSVREGYGPPCQDSDLIAMCRLGA